MRGERAGPAMLSLLVGLAWGLVCTCPGTWSSSQWPGHQGKTLYFIPGVMGETWRVLSRREMQ